MNRSILTQYFCFFIIVFGISSVFSQDQPKNEDDILKIETDLIQTSVTVLDKKGKLVTDLEQSDFELRVDGKLVPISFFEKFFSTNTQTKKADKSQNKSVVEIRQAPISSRTFVFVVDDLHLAQPGYKLIRDFIIKFIDETMLPNDKAAIVSTSGVIGFLEQFTSDKTILKAALNRLSAVNKKSGVDMTEPLMNEYEASLINEGDEDLTKSFTDRTAALLKIEPRFARTIVLNRARTITAKTNMINQGTFTTIEESIRNTIEFPGRKTIFLLSDGFVLNHPSSNAVDYLNKIINTATRTNSVIYTFDVKGLQADRNFGESMELSDGLSNLAKSTGGTFIKNTNDLRLSLPSIIEELSSYYVLAWEPPIDESKSIKLRKIEVIVKNRPDLKVQMQSGYLNNTSNVATEKTKKEKPKEPVSVANVDLTKALVKHNPSKDLPTAVVANFVNNEENENIVATTVQIEVDETEFTIQAEKAIAEIDLVGIVYNSKGERVDSFNQTLTVEAKSSKVNKDNLTPLIYSHQTKLKPDLYQIRVAARGKKTARTGSANNWVNIPDLSKPEIALSSLIINEIKRDIKTVSNVNLQKNEETIEVSIDRKFSNNSTLRFLVYIYNSKNKKNNGKTPEVFLETVILSQNKIVLTSGQSAIQTTGVDASRIPYIVEIPLGSLSRGFHELRVKVQEKLTKTSDEKIIGFEVK